MTIDANSDYPAGARLKAAYDQLKAYEEEHPDDRRMATAHAFTALVSFLGTRLRGGDGMSAEELTTLVEHMVSQGLAWAEWEPDQPTPSRVHPDLPLFGPAGVESP